MRIVGGEGTEYGVPGEQDDRRVAQVDGQRLRPICKVVMKREVLDDMLSVLDRTLGTCNDRVFVFDQRVACGREKIRIQLDALKFLTGSLTLLIPSDNL